MVVDAGRSTASSSPVVALQLRPGALVPVLAVVTLVVAGIGLALRWATLVEGADGLWLGRLTPLFDTNDEGNVPTWLQSGVLLLAALLLWTVARRAAAEGDRDARYWRGLALVFGYLSLDEAAALHELSIPVLRTQFGLSGVLRFAWVVLAVPLVAVFALLYVRFLLRLPRRTALAFVVCGGLFVGVAAGLELPQGALYEEGATTGAAFVVLTAVEELVEALVMLAFLEAVARYAAARWGGEHLEVVTSAREVRAAPASPPAPTGRSTRG